MFRSMHTFLSSLLVAALLLLAASPAVADLPTEVADDLEPITGVLVLPAAEQSVIDLDADDGVRTGDLFSVIGKGEKIVHPETGETLGTLETVKGTLRVHKVEEGFSLAEPIATKEDFARGDAVRRFSSTQAIFRDYSGRGELLYRALRDTLADLKWTAYTEAQAERPADPATPSDDPAALLFILTAQKKLEIRDNRLELLYEYAVPPTLLESAAAEKPKPEKSSTTVGQSAVVSPLEVEASSGAIVQVERPEAEGVWYGPDFPHSVVGVEVGELDGQDGIDVATLFEERLEIGRFDGQTYVKTGEVDLGSGQKALLLDGADLDGDGTFELYITASSDGQLASLVVERTPAGFEVTQDFLRWYFRTVSLPGEGPTLLAQRMGASRQDFVGPVFRVERSAGQLREGKPLELPRRVNALNFAPLAGKGGAVFARLSPLGELQVLDGKGDDLWRSRDDFGGSEAYIERPDPDEAPQTGDATRHHYMTARMLRLNEDVILVPVNEGADFISRQRTFKRSHIKAMHWNNHVMTELWHTRPVDAYLADYRVADVNGDGTEEIIMATVFTREGLFKKGRSALMAIELP